MRAPQAKLAELVQLHGAFLLTEKDRLIVQQVDGLALVVPLCSSTLFPPGASVRHHGVWSWPRTGCCSCCIL